MVWMMFHIRGFLFTTKDTKVPDNAPNFVLFVSFVVKTISQ